MNDHETRDELLRAVARMAAWGTGAVATLTAGSSLDVGPAIGTALLAAGAACAVSAMAAYGRAARAATAWKARDAMR